MHELIELAINIQGGLSRFRKFNIVTSHLGVGGVLWAMNGHGDGLDGIDVKVNLLEQKTSHIPGPEWHTVYTPDRIGIESGIGGVLHELYNPRASYAGHKWETPWTPLQLGYFTGYATWNYFNTPFQFSRPGFEVKEIENWTEKNEIQRRLIVKWPKDIHTHSSEQVLYFDRDGYIKRIDYRVEVAGNVLCAHYLSDYKEVQGIKIATKRTVYLVDKDNNAQFDSPVIVSIDFKDIKFS